MSSTTPPFLTPRIWRSSLANFKNDAMEAANVYDLATLQNIRDHGFDAIWIWCRLRDLMESAVLPELNQPTSKAAIASLRTTLERAAQVGVKLYLYFNEPVAIAADDPFWQQHPELRGASHLDYLKTIPSVSLCTSTPTVQRFLTNAIESVVDALPGLGGVILITASERHSHCWSHHARFALDDGIVHAATEPLDCPRCRNREPADIVAELTGCWRDVLHRLEPRARVLAWNWSWSMWYADPQKEVIDRLPQGVELMLDFERGDQRRWNERELLVDEYSLSFVGPSRRFSGSRAIADARGLPVHAKLQIGTTHEIASVPNLPLIPNLHAKLVQLHRMRIQGAMCTWAIGCRLSMNTFTMKLFGEDPVGYQDADLFMAALARRYLGLDDSRAMIEAWRHFSAAFDFFPFSIRFLYFGPVNVAPADCFSPALRHAPLTGTWQKREDYGDQWETSCHPFSITEAAAALGQLADRWNQGLVLMADAFSPANLLNQDEITTRQRTEEHSCARMIGIQMRSAQHLLAFHDWRLRRAATLRLRPPCDLTLDNEARDLIAREQSNIAPAVSLCQADPRLGFHDEAHGYQYDHQTIVAKLRYLQSMDARTTV